MRSQSDSIATLQAKMEKWMANGAQLGWLIDPYSPTVCIYRPGQQPEYWRNLKCSKAKARFPDFG